jgi:hypothetical protein
MMRFTFSPNVPQLIALQETEVCRIADALENIADALEKREEATSENDGWKPFYLARICRALESIQDQLPVFPPWERNQ